MIEDNDSYHFNYEKKYLEDKQAEPISLTLPLRSDEYFSRILFSLFDGLILEEWLLDIAKKKWKLDMRDRMSILLATCRDCIGVVSVEPIEEENKDE